MDVNLWRKRESFKKSIDFRYRDISCPICGKLIQAKFYDSQAKAWYFKHQRNLTKKFGKYRRESYYCEAKAAG